ncbi:hypothetical protein HBA55_16680 [Pseudomaricurvus alkylphenolicus]|jgi:hypothetical protein|uniref:hypothetical protein n=1 Tax=Pseudomaricurvus alkylphenolicus TaxID=1306991 RepID=UPI00141FEB7D|nr:hypothetical protein [Pseudomaricurvus alkylphenolicus]NIB41240.1 hypothetical protein [Pseudomaricurvus alkylphenolicus]
MFECRRKNCDNSDHCDQDGNPLPDRRKNRGLFDVKEQWWLKVQTLDNHQNQGSLELAREVMSLSQKRA